MRARVPCWMSSFSAIGSSHIGCQYDATAQKVSGQQLWLEAGPDVQIRPPALLGVDAPGDVEPEQAIEDRDAGARARQRSARLQIVPHSSPADVIEERRSERAKRAADLRAAQPEGVSDAPFTGRTRELA